MTLLHLSRDGKTCERCREDVGPKTGESYSTNRDLFDRSLNNNPDLRPCPLTPAQVRVPPIAVTDSVESLELIIRASRIALWEHDHDKTHTAGRLRYQLDGGDIFEHKGLALEKYTECRICHEQCPPQVRWTTTGPEAPES